MIVDIHQIELPLPKWSLLPNVTVGGKDDEVCNPSNKLLMRLCGSETKAEQHDASPQMLETLARGVSEGEDFAAGRRAADASPWGIGAP